MFFLSFFDATFQPTVGESVAFVEVKVALVCEEASTVPRRYASDVVGRRGSKWSNVAFCAPSWRYILSRAQSPMAGFARAPTTPEPTVRATRSPRPRRRGRECAGRLELR